ncbi:efflux RND transporter permease subunit [Macrococcus hajekii]|uniref:Efflux RND transporter permease subunit n=1 Tax=Macrococcus hajekii TaxID=198482 RepID=A0A4R6BLT8_9STAP|nr:efflux RND transporter permease subunit [Macrococcus hajekii]TDM02592.1 efflux RND transporter permease subunit [Macrococcus hajekii]GGB02222.1 multidrug ABC transporter [Macrococcus hajekii]
MNLIKLSIKRPVLTIITMLLVIILGVISLTRIPLKLIPDISPPVAVVVTSYPNAGPEEVNQKVSTPLERELSTVQGLDEISTQSQEGSSLILLKLDWNTNVKDIETDVLQKISNVNLPDDSQKPRFLKFDPSQLPVIQFGLSSDLPANQFNGKVDQLTEELKRIDGVASVDTNGSLSKEIEITVKPEDLKKSGLTFSQLSKLIASQDISLAGTNIVQDDRVISTRILSDVDSLKQLKDLPITEVMSQTVRLSDVATVEEKTVQPESITRAAGQPAVLVNVLEMSNANTTAVANQFQQTLDDKLNSSAYKGMEATVLFSQGDYINRSIKSIGTSLLLGAVFAMAVLFVFLRNIRSPLIIAVAIPYSVIFTFVLMFFSGFTLNILTLGGLALGVGMLVDNAIVVIENINRHLSMRKTPKMAAYDGAVEVAGAITGSTLTTVVVFLPVVFISGIIGDIFKEFSATIAFSLIASLVVALTVVPMLASRFLKEPKEVGRPAYQKLINRVLMAAIRHKIMTLAVVIGLIVLSAFSLIKAGMIFLPETDEGFMTVNVDMGNGVEKSVTRDALEEMTKQLDQESSIDYVLSVAAVSSRGGMGGSVNENEGAIYIKMKPLSDRSVSTSELSDRIQPELQKIARQYESQAEVTLQSSNSTGTDAKSYTFNLSHPSRQLLLKDEKKLTSALGKIEGVTAVENNLTDTTEEQVIVLDREKIAANQLNTSEIASEISTLMRGQFLFTLPLNDQLEDVYIRMPEETITERLDDIVIGRNGSKVITLKEISEVRRMDSPEKIETINKNQALQYTLTLKSGTSSSEIKDAVDKVAAEQKLDIETQLTASGDQALIDDAKDDLILALILAVLLVYFVMAAQFESFKYPFIILMTVPLTIIGIALSMFVTRIPLSLSVMIGMLVLVGIVVNNGIVLVDFINQRRREGLTKLEAVTESVTLRTRPILMTALTTILGLIPVALGLGDGGEINQPMGIVVIGGLLFSTFLTLIIIPVIYLLFEFRKN